MIVRIHSGPSLKASPAATWVGSLIRQATSSSCINSTLKLAGSDTGLNRYLCSPFQISITYVDAILPVRARLPSLSRGESLLSRSSSFRPTAFLSLAFDFPHNVSPGPHRTKISNILFDFRDTRRRPCDIGWVAGCPYSPFFRKSS